MVEGELESGKGHVHDWNYLCFGNLMCKHFSIQEHSECVVCAVQMALAGMLIVLSLSGCPWTGQWQEQMKEEVQVWIFHLKDSS